MHFAARISSLPNLRSQHRRNSSGTSLSISKSTTKLTLATQSSNQSSNERATLSLTVVHAPETRTMHHFSSDSALTLMEEDKVQRLKNCNLVRSQKCVCSASIYVCAFCVCVFPDNANLLIVK